MEHDTKFAEEARVRQELLSKREELKVSINQKSLELTKAK